MYAFTIITGKRTLWPRFNRKETTVQCNISVDFFSFLNCFFNEKLMPYATFIHNFHKCKVVQKCEVATRFCFFPSVTSNQWQYLYWNLLFGTAPIYEQLLAYVTSVHYFPVCWVVQRCEVATRFCFFPPVTSDQWQHLCWSFPLFFPFLSVESLSSTLLVRLKADYYY